MARVHSQHHHIVTRIEFPFDLPLKGTCLLRPFDSFPFEAQPSEAGLGQADFSHFMK